jgi:hypothetical protein
MQLDGLRKTRVVIDDCRFRIQCTFRMGCHGMVAFSALTAHKPPVRNRELVTGQIIARNARSSFRRGSFFPLWIPCPHHHATLARRAAVSAKATEA